VSNVISKPEISSRRMTSLVRRYGMAVVSVSIATGLGFLSKRFTPRDVEFAVFLFAVAITVWYAGAGPGALAIVLSGLSVAYFLTEPLYSLHIEPTDIPYFIIIAAFALLIAGFSSIRRRIEQVLREARDKLEIEALEKRSAELEATNRELEAFAYSVSHYLRAPLRHMVGYTELLQTNATLILDGKSRRYMMMILESAKQMGNLIDDLLAFSRMGRVEMQQTIVSLEQLVTEALREVRQETAGCKY
jgi:K+-sensing histidine kinase KdpD